MTKLDIMKTHFMTEFFLNSKEERREYRWGNKLGYIASRRIGIFSFLIISSTISITGFMGKIMILDKGILFGVSSTFITLIILLFLYHGSYIIFATILLKKDYPDEFKVQPRY